MLKLALMFGDNAVLQRDKKIAVFGQADPDAAVTVSIQGQTVTGKARPDGSFRVYVGPLSVSFEETLTVSSGADQVICRHVAVGDVFFAGGQSNMEFHMRYDADVEEEKKICENPNLRFFDYPEVSYVGQIDEADYLKNYGFWRRCTPDVLERFSAVAYYCTKEIQEKYQIPVGILACNWGGTSICAWLPRDVVAENGGQYRLDEYDAQVESLDLEAYDAAFRANPGSYKTDHLADPISDMMMFGASMEEFMAKIGEALAKAGIDPTKISPEDFQPKMGPKHEWRPCGLYESMLLPCVPYGIKAFLWYQGCSDADTEQQGRAYKELFPALIRHFRELWNEELPFLFVQLAPLRHWMMTFGTYYPITRASQQWTADNVPGTAMAVTGDVGMEWDIHPKKKQPVGHRLALLAEHYVYGEDILCESPRLEAVSVADGAAILTFAYAGEGLHFTEDGKTVTQIKAPSWLSISQNGQALDLSDAVLTAEGDTVTVRSKAIRGGQGTKASVAMLDWYVMNLYNSADIPARPAEAETP